jgi:aerobic-type carbon monoxide dehydrogenase small subunit (CoxS/CutS family)
MDVVRLHINGSEVVVEVDGSTPLLWVLRDHIGLTGTKYSCGIGMCGSCTIHLDGRAVRSCSLPVAQAVGAEITTIEGLAQAEHPLIQAWVDADVPQCGYCQPGQIMTAAALLAENPNPSDSDIDRSMDGNLCRCGTYNRIRQAIHLVVQEGV